MEPELATLFPLLSDEEIGARYGVTRTTSRSYRQKLAPSTMKKKTPVSAGTDRGLSTNPEGLDQVADKQSNSTPSA